MKSELIIFSENYSFSEFSLNGDFISIFAECLQNQIPS